MTAVFEQVTLTGSTNADLLKRAAEGAPEGLWLRADAQDQGRGRLGREWVSTNGNVYVSTIVRLGKNDPSPSTLGFVTVLAVYNALVDFAGRAKLQIKWPNDILSADGAKLCGILLERTGDAVIIGVGINLVQHPEIVGRPVTSLAALGGNPPEPQMFVERLAAVFTALLQHWREQGIAPILREWQHHAHPLHTPLQANLPDGKSMNGEYEGLSDDGALRLRLADGTIHAIHAADVFLV